MKNLTTDSLEFIKKLAEEMKSQDNRLTAFPIFVIQVDKKVYGDRSFCDEAERKEDSDGSLCKECEKLQKENEELPNYCSDCDPECFVWYKIEEEFDLQAGVFLTAKACEEHIKMNDYHYSHPRSYAIGLWRNPEMEKLVKIIFEIAGIEVPMAYK